MNKEMVDFKGNQSRLNNEELKIFIKDYLDLALYNVANKSEKNTSPDVQIISNEDFWIKATQRQIRAGQIIKLENFKLLEWIPSSPGLFYTPDAEYSRERALRSYREWEKKKFNSLFFPQKRRVIELRPDEKMGMIKGGYGSLRISPRIIGGDFQYIMCASSTGISHEGMPITVKDNQYQKVIGVINLGKVPIVSLIGRVMTLPKELSPIQLRYYPETPKYYIDIQELELVDRGATEDALVSVAITYAKKEDYLKRRKFSYSFCSFSPTGNNRELRQAVFWLQNYAERYSKDNSPVIVGEFDEEFDHFGNVEFPIKDITNGRIPIDKLHLFEEFFHFQINELIMGDKNVFKNSQIGAVGSNATSSNNSFQQINYSVPEDLDFDKLHGQLGKLRENLASKAKSPEEFKAIGEVAEAEIASKEKDGNKVVKHLKGAGKWVFDTAKDIGVDIVTELIKKQMEL